MASTHFPDDHGGLVSGHRINNPSSVGFIAFLGELSELATCQESSPLVIQTQIVLLIGLDIHSDYKYTIGSQRRQKMPDTTVVTTKGQIVIPARIRKKLNIKKGTKLHIEERGELIILRPITEAYFERLAGILPTKGRLSQALINDRLEDKERER
jgi:AbrB family looped-hinge helix DNA binding protein